MYNKSFIKKNTKCYMVRKVVMRIVGQVLSSQEANEIEFITKTFLVGRRARQLAHN